jgi:predicted Zn-dependent peptidase
MADLDAVTLDDARAFFRANYAPDNAVLAVVGDIDPEQVLRWAGRYFGSIPPHDGKVPPRDAALPDIIGAELREDIREDVPARALMAAYRMPRDGTRECDAAELATARRPGCTTGWCAATALPSRPAPGCCVWLAPPRSACWT